MSTRPKKSIRILGIDPGTRFMGVAVLEAGSLLYHDTLTIPPKLDAAETLAECKCRIGFLIDTYRPDLIAVERALIGKNPRAAIVGVLVREIARLGKRYGLEVVLFSPSAVKKFVTGYGWASKEEVASAIVARWYPELAPYLRMRNAAQDRFHQNRFDAVAVGRMGVATVGPSQS